MTDTLKKWIENKFTVGNVLNAFLIILAGVVFAVTVRGDVDTVEARQMDHLEMYEDYRFDVVPDTYMRRDVAQEQFKAIRSQLDRIEEKIDD